MHSFVLLLLLLFVSCYCLVYLFFFSSSLLLLLAEKNGVATTVAKSDVNHVFFKKYRLYIHMFYMYINLVLLARSASFKPL